MNTAICAFVMPVLLDVVIGADVAFRVGRNDAKSVHGGVVVVGSALELHERLGLRETEASLDRGIRRGMRKSGSLLRIDLVGAFPIRTGPDGTDGPVLGKPRRLRVPRPNSQNRRPFVALRRSAPNRDGREEAHPRPDE
jgi:hypothetical protein